MNTQDRIDSLSKRISDLKERWREPESRELLEVIDGLMLLVSAQQELIREQGFILDSLKPTTLTSLPVRS